MFAALTVGGVLSVFGWSLAVVGLVLVLMLLLLSATRPMTFFDYWVMGEFLKLLLQLMAVVFEALFEALRALKD